MSIHLLNELSCRLSIENSLYLFYCDQINLWESKLEESNKFLSAADSTNSKNESSHIFHEYQRYQSQLIKARKQRAKSHSMIMSLMRQYRYERSRIIFNGEASISEEKKDSV